MKSERRVSARLKFVIMHQFMWEIINIICEKSIDSSCNRLLTAVR